MTEYKKQHWLPQAYLRQFKSNSSGKDMIYLLDNERTQRNIPLKPQCQKDFTYSSSDPKGAESSFHHVEGKWIKTIESVESSIEIKKKTESILREGMIDFHARNILYEKHNDEKERIEAYRSIYITVFSIMCSGPVDSKGTTKLDEKLISNWEVQIKKSKHNILTSDNPSLGYSKKGKIILFILPLTPNLVAILFDKKKIRVKKSKELSEGDVRKISINLWKARNSCLYSNFQFPQDFIDACKQESKVASGGVYEKDTKTYFRDHWFPIENSQLSILGPSYE